MLVEVSLLASFFGGVLSLLSPCSALLLPAFFAYAFGSRRELVGKTGVFYLGLAATLPEDDIASSLQRVDDRDAETAGEMVVARARGRERRVDPPQARFGSRRLARDDRHGLDHLRDER